MFSETCGVLGGNQQGIVFFLLRVVMGHQICKLLGSQPIYSEASSLAARKDTAAIKPTLEYVGRGVGVNKFVIFFIASQKKVAM